MWTRICDARCFWGIFKRIFVNWMHIQYSSGGGGGGCLWRSNATSVGVLVVMPVPHLFLHCNCCQQIIQFLPHNTTVQCTSFNLKIFGILRCSGIFDHFIPNWITVIVPRVMHSECMFESNLCTTLTYVEKRPQHRLRFHAPSRSIYLFLFCRRCRCRVLQLYRLRRRIRYPFSCTICRNTFQYKVSLILSLSSFVFSRTRPAAATSFRFLRGGKRMPPTQKVRT